MSALTFILARAGCPKSHAVQETVTNDKRVEQHRAEVGQKRQEQEIRDNRMRFAQYLLSALRRLGVEICGAIHFLLASSKGTR